MTPQCDKDRVRSKCQRTDHRHHWTGNEGETPAAQTHRDAGCVDEALVEVAQRPLGLRLRLEADEAELAELAVLGELQAAVGQRPEGGEQLPEALLLHLQPRGRHKGGAGESPAQKDKWAQAQRPQTPQG